MYTQSFDNDNFLFEPILFEQNLNKWVNPNITLYTEFYDGVDVTNIPTVKITYFSLDPNISTDEYNPVKFETLVKVSSNINVNPILLEKIYESDYYINKEFSHTESNFVDFLNFGLEFYLNYGCRYNIWNNHNIDYDSMYGGKLWCDIFNIINGYDYAMHWKFGHIIQNEDTDEYGFKSKK